MAESRAELRTEWIESLTSWHVDKLTSGQGRQVAERGPEDRRGWSRDRLEAERGRMMS